MTVEPREDSVLSALNRTSEENVLRPKTFDSYIGQEKVKKRIKMYVESAKIRGDVIDHIILSGAPGLGKTTIANIIANEMGVKAIILAAPAITNSKDLIRHIINLGKGDILFIDEIHRLRTNIAEMLYSAMEDFRLDVMIPADKISDLESHKEIVFKSITDSTAIANIPINKFTMIGATTRTGLLTKPLFDRFGIKETLEMYDFPSLSKIIENSALALNIVLSNGASLEMAKRARGTPRIANNVLKRVNDFSLTHGYTEIDTDLVKRACDLLEVDSMGLDANDRKMLRIMIDLFKGRPIGIGTLSNAMNEEKDTIENVIEPYLIQVGFITKTVKGRQVMESAYEHLDKNVQHQMFG